MGKYRLIHVRKQNTEHLCDKVTIDGFDYYYINQIPKIDDTVYNCKSKEIYKITIEETIVNYEFPILCTNNVSIDIPQVVDQVEKLAVEITDYAYFSDSSIDYASYYKGVKTGYNKSQETHLFSEEDIIKFNVWQKSLLGSKNDNWLIKKSDKELLELWKEQQPKIVYYD